MKAAAVIIVSAAILFAFAPFSERLAAEGLSLRKAPVDKDGRFYNPWTGEAGGSFLDFLRWKLSENPYAEEKRRGVSFPVARPDFDSLNAVDGDWFVWLGHSTVLMRTGARTIITDPVFWDVNFLIKRKTPFPVEPAGLPKIDIVLISHSHYDHLDTKSIKFLRDRDDPLFITGPGYEDYFESLGIRRRASLDWSEVYASEGLVITSLPSQHWSKRTPFDGNRKLWCSFLVEHSGKRYVWIGDSGYFPGFTDIGKKYGPVDVVFAPIGAYEPRWFMKKNHMNPEEALKAAGDLRGRIFVPIHWGTFDMSDEPLRLPVERLKEAYKEGDGPALMILGHGEHLIP